MIGSSLSAITIIISNHRPVELRANLLVTKFALAFPWATIAIAFATYVVLRYTYRLTLHPLASLNLWYGSVYCDFGHGTYVFKIREMREKYGPIFRVMPDELHVNDPAFLRELMPASKHRCNKYARATQVFGFAEAAGATVDHDAYRVRRGGNVEEVFKGAGEETRTEKLFGRLGEF